jgi:hypothetical protein
MLCRRLRRTRRSTTWLILGANAKPSTRASSSQYSPDRRSQCAPGTCSRTHCSRALTDRSAFGTIHGGVRWNTESCAVRGAICGTNWIVLAPVPTTATRLPSSG